MENVKRVGYNWLAMIFIYFLFQNLLINKFLNQNSYFPKKELRCRNFNIRICIPFQFIAPILPTQASVWFWHMGTFFAYAVTNKRHILDNSILTDNVFGGVDASIQLIHIQGIAELSFDLIGMLLVRHTETIRNLNNAFVDRTCLTKSGGINGRSFGNW